MASLDIILIYLLHYRRQTVAVGVMYFYPFSDSSDQDELTVRAASPLRSPPVVPVRSPRLPRRLARNKCKAPCFHEIRTRNNGLRPSVAKIAENICDERDDLLKLFPLRSCSCSFLRTSLQVRTSTSSRAPVFPSYLVNAFPFLKRYVRGQVSSRVVSRGN